jgi:uncharacterized membrane protein
VRDRPSGERQHDVTRVEAFSDGVFAFGATLLALGIRIPRPDDADASAGLYDILITQWPSYLAFVLSFMTVGIVWANHHIMFSHFVRTDRAVVLLNIVVLMLVAFLPVPTGVLGSWLIREDQRRTAVLFYGVTLAVFGAVHTLLWWYAAYHARVTSPQLTRKERRALTLSWMVGPLLYGVATALAFIDPWYSVVVFALIHVLYVLPTARLFAVAQRARAGARSARR